MATKDCECPWLFYQRVYPVGLVGISVLYPYMKETFESTPNHLATWGTFCMIPEQAACPRTWGDVHICLINTEGIDQTMDFNPRYPSSAGSSTSIGLGDSYPTKN